MFKLPVFLLLLLSEVTLAQALPGIERVVVVGVDGLSPNGIAQANTPTLDSLIASGAYSPTAQAVMPSSSSPNWASMLMGAPPEQHTVTSNDWEPEHLQDTSLCGGKPGERWPTIFRVLREEYPEADLACFHDWSDFDRLMEPGVATMRADTRGPQRTTQAAVNYIAAYRPLFTFVHLDHVDHAGHTHAWGSSQYKQAVEEADQLIGQIIQTLRQSNMDETTVLLITSDHGGKGKKHGGNSPEKLNIPWLIAGPNIQLGYALPDSIRTFDTAATIAYLLGAEPPNCWTGRAVTSALIPETHAKQNEN